MMYFDSEFRRALSEILGNYRKSLEQALIGSSDQNYTILINDRIKKIDEYQKIIKPSLLDSLTTAKIQKLQGKEFLKNKAEELEKSYEDKLKTEVAAKEQDLQKSIRETLDKEFAEKLESEKSRIADQLRISIGEEFEKTYAEKTAELEKEYADKISALEKDYAEKLKTETERITAELREQITAELTEELTEKIKAELKQQREEKKKRKKAKKEAKAAEEVLTETEETVISQSAENPLLTKPPDSENSAIKKYKDLDDNQDIDRIN